MSLTLEKIQTVQIQEPTIRINDKKVYAVFKGGSNNIYYRYPANSNSTSQSTWNINVPSEEVFIDRKIYLKTQLRITLTGTSTTGDFQFQRGLSALRAFPLSNSISSMILTINGNAVSINLQDVVQELMRYSAVDQLDYEFSNSPCMQDQTQNYNQLINTIRNPLNDLGDSIYGEIQPRGNFPYTIISNTATEAIIDVEICEPLMISPLHFTRSLTNGFIGVKSFGLSINYDTNLGATMWSNLNDPVLTGITLSTVGVAFQSAPELLMRTISPSEINELKIPRLSIYPYHNIQVFQDTGSILAPFAQDTRSTSSINLDVIPRRIFLYVKRNHNEHTFNDTDAYFSIENISVSFSNISGQLASASKRDLYNISKKNGCNLTWTQWSGEDIDSTSGTTISSYNGIGSILCLYIPDDLTLSNSDLTSPGVNKKVNLQITVTYKNQNSVFNITPTIYTVIDFEGVFSIVKGMAVSQIGNLTEQDVLMSKKHDDITYEDVIDIYGGDFLSDIGSFIKKIPQGIVDVSKWIQKNILPIAKAVVPLLGMGLIDEQNLSGGLYVGGAKMDRKQIMDKRQMMKKKPRIRR